MHRSQFVFLIGLCILITLGFVAVPATASPQPSEICGPCGSSFAEAAEDQGVAVNVTETTVSIQIHPNGSATWLVTNHLTESTAGLSTDPETLDHIAREATTSGGLPDGYGDDQVEFQSSTLENNTVQIMFRDPDAANHHFSVFVVDYFHSEGLNAGRILNADSVSIHGPAETVVLNDPREFAGHNHEGDDEHPTVTDNTLRWDSASTDDRWAVVFDDVYLTFGEANTGSLRLQAALTMTSVPIWLENIGSFVLPAVFVYGLLLTGVTVGARWAVDTAPDTDRLAAVIAGIGGVIIGIAASSLIPATLAGLGIIYLVVGLSVWLRPSLLRSVRGALAVGFVSTIAVGITVAGLEGVDTSFVSLTSTVGYVMAIHLPLAIAPAFGLAIRQNEESNSARPTVAAFAGACSTVLIAGMVYIPFDARPFGLIIVFTVGGAVFAAFFGLPLAMLGACQLSTDYVGNKAQD